MNKVWVQIKHKLVDLCQILMLSRAVHETEVRKMDKQPGRAWTIRAIVKNIFGQVLMNYSWVVSGNPLFWLRDEMSHFLGWARFWRSTTLFFFTSFFLLVGTKLPSRLPLNTHDHLKCTFLWIKTHIKDHVLFIHLFAVTLVCKCEPFPWPFQAPGAASLDLLFPIFTIQSVLEDKRMHNNNWNAKLLVQIFQECKYNRWQRLAKHTPLGEMLLFTQV